MPNSLNRAYTPIKDLARKQEDVRGHDAGIKPSGRKKLTRRHLSAQVIKDVIEAATVHNKSHADISI